MCKNEQKVQEIKVDMLPICICSNIFLFVKLFPKFHGSFSCNPIIVVSCLLVLQTGNLFHFFLQIQAARETGALQAAKNKLEKQVEELTWRLQLEKRMRVSILQ